MATLGDAPKTSEEKIYELEARLASNTRAIAHLAMFMKDHCSSSLRVAAENGVLQKNVSEIEGKTVKALLSAEQLQAKVSAMTKERDFFGGKM